MSNRIILCEKSIIVNVYSTFPFFHFIVIKIFYIRMYIFNFFFFFYLLEICMKDQEWNDNLILWVLRWQCQVLAWDVYILLLITFDSSKIESSTHLKNTVEDTYKGIRTLKIQAKTWNSSQLLVCDYHHFPPDTSYYEHARINTIISLYFIKWISVQHIY